MFDPVRRHHEGWLPLAAGLAWTAMALSAGWPWGLPALLPGVFLTGSGAGMLVWPGDRRQAHIAALGGVVGVLLSVPALLAGAEGLGLALLSAAALWAAGHHAVVIEPRVEGVPAYPPSPRLAAEVALDEAVLGTMVFTQWFPSMADHVRIRREVDEALEQFADAGWLDKPAAYHQTPPAPERIRLTRRSLRGHDYEHWSAPSEYAPREGEPGRGRWLDYAPTAMSHAWVVRGDAERPWLLCIHGYRMGHPLIDLGAFEPAWFHHKLGLNLVIPTLPLHGLRKVGRRSGDGFLGGDLLDSIHAEAQAMWDLRRLMAWVRSQTDAPVGAYGLSLGGYTTALLAGLEPDLACAIPGIPATDFARLFYHHGEPRQERAALSVGLTREKMSEVLRVVSPLALDPVVEKSRRAIFGGLADQLVPADQVRDLWLHWDRPRIEWYPGAHLTLGFHAGVRRLLFETLSATGLARG